MVVAPATANTLAKMAAAWPTTCSRPSTSRSVARSSWPHHELGDVRTPGHAARTCASSRSVGSEVLPTERGDLACGEEGPGRMAAPETHRLAVKRAFARPARGPLAGPQGRRHGGRHARAHRRRALHRQPLERQDGPRGRRRGVPARRRRVVLVTAAEAPQAPYSVVRVESTAEMAAAVRAETADADVLVMSAAVADFTPAARATPARSSAPAAKTLTLDLVRTTDILADSARPGLVRVGFAAEAGPQLARAREKRRVKGCELMVFNDILGAGIGIGADENEITIIGDAGERHVPRAAKTVCAAAIADEIAHLLAVGSAIDATESQTSLGAGRGTCRQRASAPSHAGHRGHHARRRAALRRRP